MKTYYTRKGFEEGVSSKNREIILIAASALFLGGIIRYGYDKYKENKRQKNKVNAKEHINIKKLENELLSTMKQDTKTEVELMKEPTEKDLEYNEGSAKTYLEGN